MNYRVGITKDLRALVYHKFLKLPVSFFTEQRKGDMMSRISNDVGNVENSIMGSLVDVINAPFMIVSSFITLFALSPKLTVLFIGFSYHGRYYLLGRKKFEKHSMKAQEELGNLFSLVDETLKSSKIIKFLMRIKSLILDLIKPPTIGRITLLL